MSPSRAWADKLLTLELERLTPTRDPQPEMWAPVSEEQAAHNRAVLEHALEGWAGP